MLADRLLIGALQEAIDLAVGVVVQLNLPHTELIGSAVPRSLGYLIDGFLRQLQVLVEIHEPRHAVPPRHASRHYCAPVTGTLSTPRIPSGRRRVTPGGRHSTATAHRLAMPRSGRAGDSTGAPPKPISYAVFCLKKKIRTPYPYVSCEAGSSPRAPILPARSRRASTCTSAT